MIFSLIIPTYNRLDELRELIPTIEQQDYDLTSVELVIVDDGSTDGTSEYINSYTSNLKITYVKQQNQGPGPARNRGMSLATGEYFIFVDSDCLLPPEYFSELAAGIAAEGFEAFGGPDTYHPSFSPLLKAINYSMTSFIGTGGTRGSKKSIAKFYPRSFNMGMARTVYDTIGGFGSLRHGQDMDYSARIYAAGFKVGLISEAFVYHKRRTSLWRFFKQIHNWGVTRINLAALHPNMLKPIHLAPAVILLIGLSILVLALFFSWSFMLLKLGLIGLLVLTIFITIQSFLEYRSLKVASLSILTLFIQVFAYAVGSLNGIWQKWIMKKPTAIGITKNYYK